MPEVMIGTGTDDKLSFIKTLMESNQLKFTKQRQLILEQFFTTDRHLTAEEVYLQLKKQNIGLATVYRNIKIFAGLGILREIAAEGVSYYELKIYSKKPIHLHFQCIQCNDIIDIDEKEVVIEFLELNKTIENLTELKIYDANILFVGLCKRCREVNKWQGQ